MRPSPLCSWAGIGVLAQLCRQLTALGAGREYERVIRPLRPFRLVYRAFDAFEFDPAKSDAVFELRGFDLAYARRVFPGYVLEREDTRGNYGEPRFRVIEEVLQDIFVVVYTPRAGTCRLITAWEAEDWELNLWYERYS